jgi:hypothetical protein
MTVSSALSDAIANVAESPQPAVIPKRRSVVISAPVEDEAKDSKEAYFPADDEDTALEQVAEAPAKKAAEPEAIEHPSYVLDLARDAGLTEEQIQANSTSDIVQYIRGLNKARTESQPRRDAEKVQEAPAVEPTEDEILDSTFKELEEEAGLDPTYVAALKKSQKKMLALASKGLQKEVEQLKSKLAEREKAEAQQAAERQYEAIDAAFDALGNEALFGAGRRGGSKEATYRRQSVVNLLSQMAEDDAKSGKKTRTMGQLVKDAATLLYPIALSASSKPEEELEAPTPKKTALQQRAEEWQEGALSLPNSRAGRVLPPGDEKAAMEVAKAMGKKYVPRDDDDDTV